VLLDTNVIIRYLLEEETEHGKSARDIFNKIESGVIKAIILDAVFTECVYILEKVYKVPKSLIAENLTGLLQYKGLNMDNKAELIRSLEYYHDTNLHIVDCLLAANAQAHDIELFSFDAELLKFITKITTISTHYSDL
jgi:predicted nucleic-acid-binding protein